MNNTAIYTEKSRMPQWVFWLIGIQGITVSAMMWKTEGIETFLIVLGSNLLIVGLLSWAGIRLTFSPKQLRYKGTPFPFKEKQIDWQNAENISVIKVDPMGDFLGWGYKKSAKYGWGHIYDGDYALFVTLHDGRKMTFTLKNKDEAMHFLAKNNIPFTA